MMNDKIVIQEVTEARSATGAVTETWSTFTTCWADVSQISGNENFNSDMLIYNDIKSFKCYYSEVKDVTPKMRLIYRDQYYNITSIAFKDRLKADITAIRYDDE